MRILKFRAWLENEPLGLDNYSLLKDGSLQVAHTGMVIEQYTGLLDKNGKEIYEGDILLANCAPSGHPKKNKQHKVIMEWCLREWDVVIIDYEIGSKWRTSYMKWGYEGNALEVIGNIHLNPELLERK